MQQTSHNIKSERGQTFTEFALVVPILIVLMLGIVQFGVVFNNYVTLTNAVRAGARTGVVLRNSPNPTQACVDQVRSSASNLKQADLTVSCSSSWQVGTDVTVTASYPYGIKLLNWLVVSGSLNSTMKERVE